MIETREQLLRLLQHGGTIRRVVPPEQIGEQYGEYWSGDYVIGSAEVITVIHELWQDGYLMRIMHGYNPHPAHKDESHVWELWAKKSIFGAGGLQTRL